MELLKSFKDLKDPFDKRWKENAETIIENFFKEFDDEDLRYIVAQLKELQKAEFFKRLFYSYKLGKGIIAPDFRLTAEEYQGRRLALMAYDNLSFPPINLPFFMDLIHRWHIYAMYGFLEYLYYLNTERPLNHEDGVNLYLGRLDEFLLFGLDKFDENPEIPEPSPDYFKKLKKAKWENKTIRKLFFRLGVIRKIIQRDSATPFSFINLKGTEDQFTLLLAACSAVNDGREKISKKDLVKAYKTYLKLLKTDITKFKAKSELIVSEGYLVCDKCNEYYKLQPGESPDDFTGECKCGGKLKFYENIDWLLEGGGDVGADD